MWGSASLPSPRMRASSISVARIVVDDEQRVGLALDAMGRRLRAPRLPGVDVPPRWRWADVYVSGLGPRDHVSGLGPRDRWLSLSWCPGALSPGARCDGPTSTCPSTSACWPTVLLADGV